MPASILRSIIMAPGLLFILVFILSGASPTGFIQALWRFSESLKRLADQGLEPVHYFVMLGLWGLGAILALLIFENVLSRRFKPGRREEPVS